MIAVLPFSRCLVEEEIEICDSLTLFPPGEWERLGLLEELPPATNWTSWRLRKSSEEKIPMPECHHQVARKVISQESMIAVLNRCDETREFMVQMWLQNPDLARQGGAKVAALLAPLQTLQTSSQ